jgi:hypothetical protein
MTQLENEFPNARRALTETDLETIVGGAQTAAGAATAPQTKGPVQLMPTIAIIAILIGM